MDRRRFYDVSKTRPRRPQDPPPVRRHPKRIPNLASARLSLSLCLTFLLSLANFAVFHVFLAPFVDLQGQSNSFLQQFSRVHLTRLT